MIKNWLYAAAAVALLALPVAADVWDLQGNNDDNPGTDNHLLPGTKQDHDLGARPGPVADVDWYSVSEKRLSSYEIIVDGISGDLGSSPSNPLVERIKTDAVSILQTATTPVLGGWGLGRALRWANFTSGTLDNYVRVSGGVCGTSCTANDVYKIRMHETTVNISRFNTSGSQVTIVITQNASERPILEGLYFWNPDGVLLATVFATLASHATFVFNTATLGVLVGQSGSITIAHDGSYGGLVAKSVALEPSTGFSFDTPGVYVPD